jgi:hypothetical protein
MHEKVERKRKTFMPVDVTALDIKSNIELNQNSEIDTIHDQSQSKIVTDISEKLKQNDKKDQLLNLATEKKRLSPYHVSYVNHYKSLLGISTVIIAFHAPSPYNDGKTVKLSKLDNVNDKARRSMLKAINAEFPYYLQDNTLVLVIQNVNKIRAKRLPELLKNHLRTLIPTYSALFTYPETALNFQITRSELIIGGEDNTILDPSKPVCSTDSNDKIYSLCLANFLIEGFYSEMLSSNEYLIGLEIDNTWLQVIVKDDGFAQKFNELKYSFRHVMATQMVFNKQDLYKNHQSYVNKILLHEHGVTFIINDKQVFINKAFSTESVDKKMPTLKILDFLNNICTELTVNNKKAYICNFFLGMDQIVKKIVFREVSNNYLIYIYIDYLQIVIKIRLNVPVPHEVDNILLDRFIKLKENSNIPVYLEMGIKGVIINKPVDNAKHITADDHRSKSGNQAEHGIQTESKHANELKHVLSKSVYQSDSKSEHMKLFIDKGKLHIGGNVLPKPENIQRPDINSAKSGYRFQLSDELVKIIKLEQTTDNDLFILELGYEEIIFEGTILLTLKEQKLLTLMYRQ